MPALPAQLSLQYPKLMAKSQYLGPELGVGPAAEDQGLEQEADNRVGEGVEHDRGAWQKPTVPPPRPRPENELT